MTVVLSLFGWVSKTPVEVPRFKSPLVAHRFGKPIQQVIHERGLHRSQVTSDMVAAWAREHDRAATSLQPEMTDGQAIIFDGRLWHGSHNTGPAKRSALILQYAAAGTPVVFPDLDKLDRWPFCFSAERPSSLLVAGKGVESASMPRPAGFSEKPLPIDTYLRGGEGFLASSDGWKPYRLINGSTPILAGMKAHVSVLSPGHCPHPPHCHIQEELLVVLDGEAEILIADSPDPADAAVKRCGPGSFVYYPAYQHHTIRNVAAAPVTYLMFKWQAAPFEVREPLDTTLSDIGGRFAAPRGTPRTTRVLFEGPTAYLRQAACSRYRATARRRLPGSCRQIRRSDHRILRNPRDPGQNGRTRRFDLLRGRPAPWHAECGERSREIPGFRIPRSPGPASRSAVTRRCGAPRDDIVCAG